MNNLRISKKEPNIIRYDGLNGGTLQILEENKFHFKVKGEKSGIFFLPKMLVKDERKV